MQIYQCLPSSYVKILKQTCPEPYSRYKRGDQIDLEAMIAQIEWESGIRENTQVDSAPGTPAVFEDDIIFYEYTDGIYALGYKIDPNTMQLLEAIKISRDTKVEFLDINN